MRSYLKRIDMSFIDTLASVLLVIFVVIHLILSSLGTLSSLSSLSFYFTYIIVLFWFLLKAVCIVKDWKNGTGSRKNNLLFIIVCLTLFFILLNSIISYIFYGVAFTFEGIKKISAFAACLMFIFCCVFSKNNKKTIYLAIFCSVMLMLSFLFVFITKYHSIFRGLNHTFLTLNLSNPNFTGLVLFSLLSILFYGLFIAKNIVHKAILYFCLFVGFVFLYLTSARGPLLSILAFMLFAIFYLKTKKIHFNKCLVLFIVMVPFLFVISYIPFIYLKNLGINNDIYVIQTNAKTIDTRFGVWTDGFKLISSRFPFNLFFGVYGKYNGMAHFHNSMLDVLVCFGLLPFILSSLCLVLFFLQIQDNSNIMTSSQKVALLVYFGVLITGITESSVFSSGSGIYILNFIPILFIKYPLNNDLVYESNLFKNINKKEPMDVLIINNVYEYGSTGNIVKNLKCDLSKKLNVFVAYGRRNNFVTDENVFKFCSEFESKVSHFLSNLFHNPYGFCYFSTFRIIKIIKKYKPSIVHLHCLNDYYVNNFMLLKFLKRKNIKVVLTLHAENIYNGICGGYVFNCEEWKKTTGCKYCNRRFKKSAFFTWNRFKKIFNGFENLKICSVSPWLCERAKSSPYLSFLEHHVVMNSTNSEFFFKNEKNNLRKKYNLPLNKKIVLHITSNYKNEIKGGKYFVELAKSFLDNEYTFLLVSLSEITEKLPKNIIIRNGSTDLNVISDYYNLADVIIVPSKAETFSMPVAESLVCGTPVVGFLAGGPESIAIKHYSKFTNYGDLDALRSALMKVLKSNFDEEEIAKKATAVYSHEIMSENYYKIYCDKQIFVSKKSLFKELNI